jgi:hypothetical protein
MVTKSNIQAVKNIGMLSNDCVSVCCVPITFKNTSPPSPDICHFFLKNIKTALQLIVGVDNGDKYVIYKNRNSFAITIKCINIS